MPSNRFFQAGGSLSVSLPSYIERQADEDLYLHLKQFDFCYVLTARQMGKSSLKVRTMNRLVKEDWATASIDLTSFGTTGFTVEQWYLSFLSEIADALDIDEHFDEWWDKNLGITPVARMSHFWEEVLLKNIKQNIIIFIDEIDSILSLKDKSFSTDDFFAAIRAVYNKRSEKKDFQRLNFAIFGVAAPEDLMGDHERTPFNIGVPIPLHNFSSEEVSSLKEGFSSEEVANSLMLERIMHWTAGQPYLTQELSQKLSQTVCKKEEINQVVDDFVAKTFLKADIFNSPHFSNIQTRILSNDRYRLRMLDIYKKVFNKETYNASIKDNSQLYLKLSGLVKERNGLLKINNRIYNNVFNHEWLKKSYESVQRPFALDLRRWINTGKSDDALLKGMVLKEAEKWAASREDLTNSEKDFLQASRLVEVKLEKERFLRIEKEKQRKRLQLALVVVVFAAILALFMGIIANNQAKLTEKEKGLKQAEVQARKKAVERGDSLDILLIRLNDALILAENEKEKNRILAKNEAEAKALAIDQKIITEQAFKKLQSLNDTLSSERKQLEIAKKSLELQKDLTEEQKVIAQLVAESRRAYSLIISSIEERKERPDFSFRLAEAAFNLNQSDIVIERNLLNSYYDGLDLNFPQKVDPEKLDIPLTKNSKRYNTRLEDKKLVLKDFRNNDLQSFNIDFQIIEVLFTLNDSHVIVQNTLGEFYGWVIDAELIIESANSYGIKSLSLEDKLKYAIN